MAVKKIPSSRTVGVKESKEVIDNPFNETATHREYKKFQDRWLQLHACLEGEEDIKSFGEKYLPYPVRVDDADRIVKISKLCINYI